MSSKNRNKVWGPATAAEYHAAKIARIKQGFSRGEAVAEYYGRKGISSEAAITDECGRDTTH